MLRLIEPELVPLTRDDPVSLTFVPKATLHLFRFGTGIILGLQDTGLAPLAPQFNSPPPGLISNRPLPILFTQSLESSLWVHTGFMMVSLHMVLMAALHLALDFQVLEEPTECFEGPCLQRAHTRYLVSYPFGPHAARTPINPASSPMSTCPPAHPAMDLPLPANLGRTFSPFPHSRTAFKPSGHQSTAPL